MPLQKRAGKQDRAASPEQVFWDDLLKFRGRLDIGDFKHLVLSLLYLRCKAGIETSKRVAAVSDSNTAFSIIDDAIKSSVGVDIRTVPVDLNMLRELIVIVEKLEPASIPAVFEFSIEKFAQIEGRSGAEYCSPQWLVQLLVQLAAPARGNIYDPCCGSGGLLAHAWIHAKTRGGDVRVFGQESNLSTWRICKMNLGTRGVTCELGNGHADTFKNDLHSGVLADCVLANPPFNLERWNTHEGEQHWPFGAPPDNNGNFAWIQQIIRHLAPGGQAAFTMSNGALSSKTCGEGEIRKQIVNAGWVDCIIGLPSRLFHTTRIPASIWILSRKNTVAANQQCLFINAQEMGRMVDRIHCALSSEEIATIVGAYHSWRAREPQFKNVPGFCHATGLEEIRSNNHILTPGRYVPTAAAQQGDVPPGKIADLARQLDLQFKESIRLEQLIRSNIQQVGNGA